MLTNGPVFISHMITEFFHKVRMKIPNRIQAETRCPVWAWWIVRDTPSPPLWELWGYRNQEEREMRQRNTSKDWQHSKGWIGEKFGTELSWGTNPGAKEIVVGTAGKDLAGIPIVAGGWVKLSFMRLLRGDGKTHEELGTQAAHSLTQPL